MRFLTVFVTVALIALGTTLLNPSQVLAVSISISKPQAPVAPSVPTFGLIFRTPSPDPTPEVTSTPKPTVIPSPTPVPTVKPASTAQPTQAPISVPTSTPKPTAAPTSSSLSVKDYIMGEINKYRASQGLYLVKTDPYTCNFAKIRAQEIVSGFNHNGFTNRVNSKTLPYPSYHYVNENIARTSNFKNVVNMWINSSGHAKNMRADTPFVCVEASGSNYAYEGWRP